MKSLKILLLMIGIANMAMSNLSYSQNLSKIKNSEEFLINASEKMTWRIVNDDVMGGLSESTLERSAQNESWIFRGNLSLENNGGFASIRSPQKEYDFKNYKGIEVKVRGDGKNYGILLSEDYYFTGFYYHYSFSTPPDEWMTIQLNFDQFLPQYFGRPFEISRKVELDQIKELSLIIGDKQSGPFQIEIAWIKLIP